MRSASGFLTGAILVFAMACATPMATAPEPEPVTTPPAPLLTMEPVPVAELVREVEIPYEQFTLDNGLRVIVHEDRKAPVVAVSVWYNVGSKDEPKGKTGFAHLFEHLMFNGSENAPGDYFEPLRQIGATDLNGTTWFDRTNYFQTVPTPALETALFLESDRMGHLLGAVTQEKLDNQRGVVQNEKRQGDNQPYGLVDYAQLSVLPEGHPYAHSTIGSMADLDSASLEDVKQWFRDKYGPNNAVLVLAGDVDTETAKRLVNQYFGDIPRGPINHPAEASIPVLDEAVHIDMQDRVATTRLYRNWMTPGLTDPESIPLDVGMTVLGGLASSRLDNILVREEQLAVRVAAFLQDFHRLGFAEVQVDVKPGVDADMVARRLDEIIAEFIANGPTEDEVQRVAMRQVSNRIKGLEQVGGFGGKAVALAEGALYMNDPDFFRTQLLAYGRVTPAQVQQMMEKWLTRPRLTLRVTPGERGEYEEAASVGSFTQRPSYFRPPADGDELMAPVPKVMADREWPTVGTIQDLDFPDVERTRLSNGIPVVYARRDVVPVVRIAVELNAGHAADPKEKLGTQALMLNLLEEGTTSMNSIELAEAQERLGAAISTGASLDRTAVTMSALTPNLLPSLALMADIIRNPAFAPREIERLRDQQITSIASEMTQPFAIAYRSLPPLIYGDEHPYGIPFTGSGDPELLKTVTRDDLIRFHQTWIRPDNATIFAVGDIPLAELTPMLESQFGAWEAPATPKGVKRFDAEVPPARPRIVIIDRPQSPQSLILAGTILPVKGTDDLLVLNAANEVLGGNFLSRLNMDLRETKGWAYGVRGFINQIEMDSPYLVYAPVQADKTGPSIAALMGDIEAFLGDSGVTAAELERTINGNVRQLAGSFETSADVLSALRSNALFRRPDNYYESVADRYRALQAAELDAAARAAIDPEKLIWVVIGDESVIRPQLEELGMPIETMTLN
ncbi:MAG: insulinase family protein [Acidobacteria bacterium]|nr:insulinase family protein [Acidobacteriota bacterium]